MGKYAIVKNDKVQNIIAIDSNQISEFEIILKAELVDALPYGLSIGDLRVGNNWTRNINGVQTVLEEITPEQQTDYNNLIDTITNLTEELNNLNNQMEEAASYILEGVESIE